MTIKTPVKATFTGSDVTGLAEFQSADFIGVIDGGTGAVTFTSNSILLGNGTDAIQSSPIQISGSTISVSDSTTITIDEGLSVTGTITSGNLLPPTDNTGVVGNNSFTWNNGQFTDLTVDDVLTVRTAIDLADGDILRFGTNDDWELFHDGTANRIDLNVGDLTIRDGITTRFTFGRTTGDFTATGNIALQSSITLEGSTADDFETNLTVVDPTADRTITLPNATGQVVLRDTTDTLTNKTLTTPVISSISNTGTITLPTSTDTLVGRATTDTLTNKTIDADNNTLSNIGDSELSSGISATKIGNGDVDNTELSYLNGVTSAIQTQIDTKASTAFAIAQAVALG